MQTYQINTLHSLIQVLEMAQKKRISLKEYQATIRKQLEEKGLDPEIRGILKDSLEWSSKLSKLRKRYRESIDDHFSKSPQPQPFIGQNSINDHMRTYYDLLIHSIYAADISLLKKWGVDHPYNKNCYQKSDPNAYISRFKKWEKNSKAFKEFENTVKPYLNYLIKEFQKKFL